MTQDDLEMTRLGLVTARLQFKAMSAVAFATQQYLASEEFSRYELECERICKAIETGAISPT
jgi:hypothetical protein